MIYDLDGNLLENGYLSLVSEEQKTLSLRIQCRSGYGLRASVPAGLTVEAKKPADVSWANIGTSPIDLTPDANTVQTYQIRFTAAATADRVRRNPVLSVEPL
ncbi:MAG: hypothetical protein KF831_06960 [Acidobacteria bacterium]|nr:hypothetical protein [Acidobacteriota bacterium]